MNVIQLPRRFVKSEWGGTETVILETSKRLEKMGHHTEIFCPNALAASNLEKLDNIEIHRFNYFYPYLGLRKEAKHQLDHKGGNLFSFSLMRALQKFPSLNLIHLHTGKRLGGIARFVAQKRKIPYIVSLHGGLFDVPTDEAKAWTEPTMGSYEWGKALGWVVGSRRVMDDAAVILCVGKPEQIETQKRYPNKKVVYLPNGVDPEKFAQGNGRAFRSKYNIPQNANVLLTVGRIDPQKNQLFPVQLLPELIKGDAHAHLVLIGHITNDDYYKKLLSVVNEMELENRVTLISGLDSESSDLKDAYKAADIFLLPSIHEPFGIVILEAWAAGLPVIAHRVGGIPAFVEDGKDGLLFDTANEQTFIKAYMTLIKDSEKRKSLADAGNQKARSEYSWDSITGKLINIYEEAIDENPLR
ncbi:MAG: glycosyltransferase family 4 protein [Acidobacteriota bacterium]